MPDSKTIYYSIRDISKLTGIKAHTIRSWESRYNILKPHRNESNVRCYTDEDLQILMDVFILREEGMKISQIADLTSSEIKTRVEKVQNNFLQEGEEEINLLIMKLLKFNELEFIQEMNRLSRIIGFERTIKEVMSKLIDKLSLLWITGSMSLVQEKYMNRVLKEYIIQSIGNFESTARIKPDMPTVLLYLNPTEQNEVSFYITHYLFRKKLFNVINLGRNINQKDISNILKTQNVDYIFTIFNAEQTIFETSKYLDALLSRIDKTTLIVSGTEVSHSDNEDEDFIVLDSIDDIENFINNLNYE